VASGIRSYHLPNSVGPIATEPGIFGAVSIERPRLAPGQVHAALAALRHAAATHLRQRSIDRLLEHLDAVASQWVAPDSRPRRVAERILPAVTGFSSEMIRHGLPWLLEPLRGEAIAALLSSELGGRECKGRVAVAPLCITHVMSGNIPGLAAAPMLLSLALRSAPFIKPAAGDLLFPALLAASIAEIDEELGQCIGVAPWRGGDAAIEEIAFAESELVVASGSDAAIEAIRGRVRGRCIAHGHKISFAAIGRESLNDAGNARRIAQRLAYDVSVWDQQGCLSPQLCYVEGGGRILPNEFAESLAVALDECARELPGRRLSFEEQAAILGFRQEAEWRAADEPEAGLLSSEGGIDWSVSVEPDARFVPSCLNRCVRLKVVPDLAVLSSALAPHRRHLEAAGLAVGADRLHEIASLLANCGVHRICPIGTMQRPTLSWRPSGRPRLADWIEWATIEDEVK
jgi:hypothetical protein